jgi:hypothetical protein
MKVKTDPLVRHRDHLALIEGLIDVVEAAVAKHEQNIRQMLRDDADVAAESGALRLSTQALKRLRADRLATLNQISRQAKIRAF